jgi:glucose/arabinose dehydrogenase
LTYAEPGDGGSGLALARAKLTFGEGTASLDGLDVLWRQMPKGKGGQFGAQIAFSPDGQYLFLTVGERQRMTPAQDPDQELGKILRLTLDGKPAPGNPMAGRRARRPFPDRSAARYGVAKTAPVIVLHVPSGRTWRRRRRGAPATARLTAWRSRLMAGYGKSSSPRGGDELNPIEPGKNYGWPLVSYAVNYNGVAIPSPDTRSDLAKLVIYWTPVIAPGSLTFYTGAMFRSGRAQRSRRHGHADLNRITFDAQGRRQACGTLERHHRIRDVEVAPTARSGCSKTPIPAGCSRDASRGVESTILRTEETSR